MNDAGYTLVEMLAALFIIGLAIAGLAEGMAAIGKSQSAATSLLVTQRAGARADRDLVQLFQGQGPFRSDDPASVTGGRSRLAFACGARSCSAGVLPRGNDAVLAVSGLDGWRDAVLLPGARDARFAYVDDAGQHSAWPPPGDGERRKVRAVMVVTGPSGAPSAVAGARLWIDQAPDCAFDPILGDCRASAP